MDARTIGLGDVATVLSAPPPATDDADATRLTPPPASVDADATRLTPTPADADASATILAAAPGRESTAGPLTIGDQFGRYTIVKMLGVGGMGAVYQAWDTELEVVVALKVIRPEVLRDPAAEEEIERRFKRELLLARQVTHKNVVRIHDLGEIRGIKYITMTFVGGTDLATLIKREGRLPIQRILPIMRSAVAGLVAAHAAGVVHRDLKPANIMIDANGEAFIMDFGIARSTGGPAELPPAGAAHGGLRASGRYTDATVLGSIVGTIEYMAPEQARGEAVDQRADIYATGLILYDLLTGRRRAEGAGSALDQLRARMDTALPPVKSLVPDLPDALAAIVTRAVEPDAAKRFQTTTDLADALDRLDDHGVPRPVKRVVSLPIAAGSGRSPARGVGRRMVVRAAAHPAGPARSGVGRHRGLREPHGRPGVRPHARTDAAARARRRRLHHRVRPQRHQAHRRRRAAGEARRGRRARTGGQAGPGCRAVRAPSTSRAPATPCR